MFRPGATSISDSNFTMNFREEAMADRFVVAERHGIRETRTADQPFEQAGFVKLL